ncbi:isochorismatase family protein [Sphingomonas aliaeris]|uniref:Isochorismatase family protein n=1 Tax=Sphingomonas aliaeris TaxID=2759526 RepID=A0A974NVN8_9SPHN|nr:isochorismatase family protein [Sphingomonas aliaeris]QQV77914.1 isochorismatase family protein [Sphingomonas aliaeris]
MTATDQALQHADYYEDPAVGSLPTTGFVFRRETAALVVVDPQNDFLTEGGVAWGLVGESVVENDTVANIGRLFAAAKDAGIPVAISPHYYYHSDHDWNFGGPSEHLMHEIGMFDRSGPLSLEGFDRSGADFLEVYKPFKRHGNGTSSTDPIG